MNSERPHPAGGQRLADATEARLVEDLYLQTPTIVVGMSMLTLVNCVYYWNRLPFELIAPWLAATGLSMTMRLWYLRRYRIDPAQLTGAQWIWPLALASGLLGVATGTFAGMVTLLTEPEVAMIAVIGGAGAIGTATATSSASPLIFRVFSFTTLLPIALVMLVGGNVTYQVLGVLLLINLLALNRGVLRLHETLRQSIESSLENDSLVDSLREQSRIDDLTGLSNRRALNQRFDELQADHGAGGGSLGLVICDVDCFKAFNDSLGHPEGDRCLQAVAAALREVTRASDQITARYGGEEFAVLVPDCEREQLEEIAERVRGAVAALRIPHPASDVAPYVTVSVGASLLHRSAATSIEDLINRADSALYRAKADGRNRLRVAAAG